MALIQDQMYQAVAAAAAAVALAVVAVPFVFVAFRLCYLINDS